MNRIKLPATDLSVSSIGYGCMNLGGSWDNNPVSESELARARAAISAAIESGINLFDHADIYSFGKSEKIFADVMRNLSLKREDIIIQSKCGIRFRGVPNASDPQRYDFSYDHILKSVEESLIRLDTGYLDILLLHRPDPLMIPDEVGRAFDHLEQTGKVKYFGISNFNSAQIKYLQKHLDQKLMINQVELSLVHHYLISDGIFFNRSTNVFHHADDTIYYCGSEGIFIQAYSPLARGVKSAQSNQEKSLNRNLHEAILNMASQKSVSIESILLAWIMKHPANIQPVIGTTNPERIKACNRACELEMTREEWYGLLTEALECALP